MNLAIKKSDHFSYADYVNWQTEQRYELIDGEAFMMAPAPDLAHQDIAGEIYRQIANSLEGKNCRPFIAPVDVRLPKHDEADERIDTVVQPDVFVVCDTAKLDRRGVLGPPDWIIEVLSPSTAGHDQIRKLSLYERSGVKEYWLVHPIDRILTVYRLCDGKYGKPEIFELQGATSSRSLPEVVIEWDELAARLPTEY
ncbi:Uma2 family endonuclease [Methylotuvimicrobium alcaliphilum]|uniref:Putative restriction endonuclease domain-containing protein n=1 Tax=Methylotuvimicrobium alcaliphilum (strain DSM 19304 / NCIMB 14124 / VKM B-2133 / 20Z) TaxID=1091494 RepID=G4T2G4_META2|nr:Uma2 family endonuclease [Methylotuvimicrobium alcaliphilum]CCE24693.1 conserved protein of unknown function [Methylotuvimicrobium alcaliphilum 20Z]